jgi:hypothetical protein
VRLAQAVDGCLERAKGYVGESREWKGGLSEVCARNVVGPAGEFRGMWATTNVRSLARQVQRGV